MQAEIEAVFLDINKDELRKRLEEFGAELVQPERLMRRTAFDLGRHEFARVRNEGDKVTMTYKCFTDNTITGAKEINLVVDDYEKAVLFLKSCGIKAKSFQENMRETWSLDGVEVDIDTWPWLPTYVEVEGPTVEATTKISEKLGFNIDDAVFGSVDDIYAKYYDVTSEEVLKWPEITFVDIPEWLAKLKK